MMTFVEKTAAGSCALSTARYRGGIQETVHLSPGTKGKLELHVMNVSGAATNGEQNVLGSGVDVGVKVGVRVYVPVWVSVTDQDADCVCVVVAVVDAVAETVAVTVAVSVAVGVVLAVTVLVMLDDFVADHDFDILRVAVTDDVVVGVADSDAEGDGDADTSSARRNTLTTLEFEQPMMTSLFHGVLVVTHVLTSLNSGGMSPNA